MSVSFSYIPFSLLSFVSFFHFAPILFYSLIPILYSLDDCWLTSFEQTGLPLECMEDDWDAYVKMMSRQGEYATLPCLIAACEVYSTKITIVNSGPVEEVFTTYGTSPAYVCSLLWYTYIYIYNYYFVSHYLSLLIRPTRSTWPFPASTTTPWCQACPLWSTSRWTCSRMTTHPFGSASSAQEGTPKPVRPATLATLTNPSSPPSKLELLFGSSTTYVCFCLFPLFGSILYLHLCNVGSSF